MRNVVRTIFSGDGTRKIEVCLRPDGTFGFSHLKWAVSEEAWIPIGPQTESVSSSAHAAAMEGLSRADWSRVDGPGPPDVDSELEAKRLIERYLNEPDFAIIDEATIEKSWGWVFFYQSKRFLETRSPSDALAGNAPLLMNRTTGEIVVTGTAESVDSYVERYEEELAGAA